MSYTGCWLCDDAELASGQCRLGVHGGTCGLINPWHHVRKMSTWVGNPSRPPYVIPRGSVGLKKNVNIESKVTFGGIASVSSTKLEERHQPPKVSFSGMFTSLTGVAGKSNLIWLGPINYKKLFRQEICLTQFQG